MQTATEHDPAARRPLDELYAERNRDAAAARSLVTAYVPLHDADPARSRATERG